ncbi:MAG: hypothetical protein K2R93_12425 [Gemmatimonadaceae bacterium]|nr:hypothetical protein [Gemmatimonadaceae bacterium]
MRLRIAVPLILIATACLSAFATCAKASGSPDAIPDDLVLTTERLAADSARVIAKWQPACDAKGCADGYAVAWTNGGKTVRTATVTGTADTVRMGLPPYGDSTRITFAITTTRRGKQGPTKTVGVTLINVDAPPPGVDSVKVDTGHVAFADSARMEVYSSSGMFMPRDSALVFEGDSILAINRHFMKPGGVRPADDTTHWEIRNITAVMEMRPPFGAWHDSVWIYAASCGCKESGDPNNRPVLNPATGKYQVRSASGGWRPVTPLSADPFRDVGTR